MHQVTKFPFLDLILWLKPHGLDKLINFLTPRSVQNYLSFTERCVRKRVKAIREAERSNNDINRNDIFYILSTTKDPETGADGFMDAELLAEAKLLTTAASHTTTTVISSFFFYLSHNPRVYDKLVKEIRSSFSDASEIIQGPKLSGLLYLRTCIDEVMRLTPGGPSEVPRLILKGGMRIDNILYPEGIEVGIPPYSMNRNEATFGDAYTFRPERWVPSDDEDKLNPVEEVQRLKRSVHTFLKGPGNCPGQNVALLQILLVLARTL